MELDRKAKRKKIVAIILGVIFIILQVMMCLSMFHLGVSYLGAIIFGWTIGIWTALFFQFVVREPITKHIEDFLKG